jgi:hypothetical protein
MHAATRIERLANKVFCFQRQQCWGLEQGFGPLITAKEIQVLSGQLREQAPELFTIESHYAEC